MSPAKTKATRAAATVAQYLDALPEDRRSVIAPMREFVRKHLPAGYQEAMSAGMITWGVPLERLPNTYNGQPLWYAALGTHKNYNTLYLMMAYGSAPLYKQLATSFKKAGKKFDMGKSCLHFKAMDDLELDAVGQAIASTPLEKYIAIYEASRKKTSRKATSRKKR